MTDDLDRAAGRFMDVSFVVAALVGVVLGALFFWVVPLLFRARTSALIVGFVLTTVTLVLISTGAWTKRVTHRDEKNSGDELDLL